MYRSLGGRVLLTLSLFVLVVSSTIGKPPPEKPSTVVAVWDWTVTDEKDKFLEKGRWTVKGFVIFNGMGKKVGSYDNVTETHVKLDIYEGRLKGKIDMYKEKGSDVNWKGELDKGGGNIYKIAAAFRREK